MSFFSIFQSDIQQNIILVYSMPVSRSHPRSPQIHYPHKATLCVEKSRIVRLNASCDRHLRSIIPYIHGIHTNVLDNESTVPQIHVRAQASAHANPVCVWIILLLASPSLSRIVSRSHISSQNENCRVFQKSTERTHVTQRILNKADGFTDDPRSRDTHCMVIVPVPCR